MRQGGEKLLETPSICSDWLDAEDTQCHEDRLSRLDWLVRHTLDGKFRIFPGGFLAKSHFDEMRYCYIYGQFLATTIFGVAYLEITLAGFRLLVADRHLTPSAPSGSRSCAVPDIPFVFGF